MLAHHPARNRLVLRTFYLAAIFAITLGSSTACANNGSTTKSVESATEVSTSVPRPIMPDVICLPLQDAQDLIQDQGVFYSRSHDATGQDRNQLVDSNWIVIDQNIQPGEQFSEGDAILQVLKLDEAKDRMLCQ